jgi:hypothetical protein
MKLLIKTYFLILCSQLLFGQNKSNFDTTNYHLSFQSKKDSRPTDNLVHDKTLHNDLYNFLITGVTDYAIDSGGYRLSAEELYSKSTYITTRNLRTDSILMDKKLLGLYATRFACMDCGSDLELYFQHKNKREYLTIDRKNLDTFELINKIKTYFLLYPNEFTEIEKIRTIKGAMEVLETRLTNAWNDW